MMMDLLGRLGPFFIGALVAYLLLAPGGKGPTFDRVIVPAARIIEREPDTVKTFVDRIVYRDAPRIQVAVAPRAAVQVVNEFCAPVVLQAVGDTLTSSRRLIAIRSGTHRPTSWWNPIAPLRRAGLTLTGFTNDGDLEQSDYSVRDGFSFRAAGDSLQVRYPRFAGAGDVVDAAGRISLLIHLIDLIRE